MKLEVKLERKKKDILTARVQSPGREGDNLLKNRQLTLVLSARREAEHALRAQLGPYAANLSITWTGEEPSPEEQETEALKQELRAAAKGKVA